MSNLNKITGDKQYYKQYKDKTSIISYYNENDNIQSNTNMLYYCSR